MCIVCVEWEKKKMTSEEALRALGEMIVSPGNTQEQIAHFWDISDKIVDKEIPLEDDDHDQAYSNFYFPYVGDDD